MIGSPIAKKYIQFYTYTRITLVNNFLQHLLHCDKFYGLLVVAEEMKHINVQLSFKSLTIFGKEIMSVDFSSF